MTKGAQRSGPSSPGENISPTVLLLIDVINDFDFPGSEHMLPAAVAAAERIRMLKREARAHGIPVIYVNDNFGHWRSDFHEITRSVREEGKHGRELVDRLHPDDDDFFVLKPRHSAFYNTTLETLLRHLEARRLILTGFSTHVCVLMSASDAYMRAYELFVPRDCTASPTARQNESALTYMVEVFDVDTRPSEELDLAELGRTNPSVAEIPIDDV